ncbi:MAG: hydrogenase maturation protease [Rhodospirillales bacterium]
MRLILGIGNRFRRDDAFGPIVLDHLQGRVGEAELREYDGEALGLLALLEGRDALVIDAARADLTPGTLLDWDALAEPWPGEAALHSSHQWGLAEALSLGRDLGRLPTRLRVLAVVGGDFGWGTDLSPEVAEKVDDVVAFASRHARAGGKNVRP